jgi:ABC-type branched-subunit amino acid transport system substrate-binding protein
MPILKMEGKLVYIWRPKQIFGGDVSRIVDALLEANVDGVAIKLHDGYYRYPDIAPVIKAIRAAGIKVGGWGYIYLYYPTSEAQAAVNSCREYGVDFYLIDAESQAKNKFSYAEILKYFKSKPARHAHCSKLVLEAKLSQRASMARVSINL